MVNRLRLVIHVLRGRPLVYRARVTDGRVMLSEHMRVDECVFTNNHLTILDPLDA
jgi:hypothetical protein